MQLPVLLLCMCALVTFTSAARLLLIPFDHHGHVNFFSIVAQELTSRGHTIDMVVADRSKHIPKKHGLNAIVAPYTVELAPQHFEKVAFGEGSVLSSALAVSSQTKIQIRDIFADASFMDKLKANNYDLMLVDGIDIGRMHYLIPYTLGVKYITLTARNDPWLARVPS